MFINFTLCFLQSTWCARPVCCNHFQAVYVVPVGLLRLPRSKVPVLCICMYILRNILWPEEMPLPILIAIPVRIQRLLQITEVTGDYWRLLEITGDYWRILFVHVDIGCRRQDIGYIPYDIQVAISHSCCRYGKYLYTVKLIGCSNTTVVDIEQIVRHYRQ